MGTVFLYVDYSVPLQSLRDFLPKLLETEPKWDGAVSGIQVTDAKESTVELRVLVSARNSADLFDLRCNVRERLIAYLHQNHPTALPTTRQMAMGSLSVSSAPPDSGATTPPSS
jgi:hypothetical protein